MLHRHNSTFIGKWEDIEIVGFKSQFTFSYGEKVIIDDIIKLCNNNIGNKFLKPTKNIKILVKNKKIFFTPNYVLP